MEKGMHHRSGNRCLRSWKRKKEGFHCELGGFTFHCPFRSVFFGAETGNFPTCPSLCQQTIASDQNLNPSVSSRFGQLSTLKAFHVAILVAAGQQRKSHRWNTGCVTDLAQCREVLFFFAVLIKWVLWSTTCGFSSFDSVCEHEISQNTAARHCKLDGDHISQDCNFRCHFAFLRGILAENHRFGKKSINPSEFGMCVSKTGSLRKNW